MDDLSLPLSTTLRIGTVSDFRHRPGFREELRLISAQPVFPGLTRGVLDPSEGDLRMLCTSIRTSLGLIPESMYVLYIYIYICGSAPSLGYNHYDRCNFVPGWRLVVVADVLAQEIKQFAMQTSASNQIPARS
jgi:hypothetical protein